MFTNGDHEPPSQPDQPGQPREQKQDELSAQHEAEASGLAGAAAELDAVEAALGRLEDGSFDACEVCGGPIGRQRLLEDPLLTRCPEHTGRP